jgi:uncharacterized protein with HEPN domain
MLAMYDKSLILEKLKQVLEAMNRINRRFSGIKSPDDFLITDDALDKLDAIAMMIITIGENIKKIDKETNGSLLNRFPKIDWMGVKGVRDVLSHAYFDIDAEEIFNICHNDIGPLMDVVSQMIKDFE